MATAPKESPTHQRGGGGGGRGGKIRKSIYRNTQSTPYDRPLIALRNSNDSVRNSNGWLSSLVDPASKLINSGARKILSSVFSKRILPAVGPKPPASDGVLQSINKHQATSSNVHSMAEHTLEEIDVVDELEKILKQKRFTRDEIDRLTALLRSRTVKGSIRGEEENLSVKIAKEQVLKHHAYTPLHGPIIPYRRNGSTPPPMRHKVFDEDISSPLELAKAYMSSRSSKLSSPMSDSRGLAHNYWTPNIQQSSSLKGSDLRKFTYGEPSSSAYELSSGQHRVSGFKNASLKRRSSVVQDEYGSIGPIRRVRQKLNLLSSKGKDTIVCDSSPLVSGSTEKTVALAGTPTSSVDPTPTHVNEVAHQTAPPLNQSIYPQDEAVSDEIFGSSAAKSPPTSASETLASKFFRNLEKGESSGVIKDAQLDKIMDDPRDMSFREDSFSALNDNMAGKNEQTNLNSFSTEKIADTKLLKGSPAEVTFCDKEDFDAGPFQKKQAFRMSILEDFIDMDEDDVEGAPSHSISATPNEERHPLTSSGGSPLSVFPTVVTEVPSAVLPSERSRNGGGRALQTSNDPTISEKSASFRDSVGASSLHSQSAVPNGVLKHSSEISLKGRDGSLFASDYSLKTSDRASSPVVATASSGSKPQAPDSELEAARFGNGPSDVDTKSKESKGDMVNPSMKPTHSFSKSAADPVAAAPASEAPSSFSFGNAANNKESPLNSSPGSSLHSTALHPNYVSDAKQSNLPATNSTIVRSNNGQFSTASDCGGELTNAQESTDNPEKALSTPSFAPLSGPSGTANSTLSSLNSIVAPSSQLHSPMTSTGMHFSSSLAPPAKDSSSAPVATSFSASSTSASSTNTTNFLFGASSGTASGTGFAFGASTTPGQKTAAATNTGFATGSVFGIASAAAPITSAANTGSDFGGSTAPASVTSGSGISSGTSSAAVNTISTVGFPFGAPTTTSSGLSSGGLSTPATTSSLFSVGASPTSATTTSSGFQFGASSTPATATSNGFHFGASSTPATTTSIGSPFGASSTPATTTSNGFQFGASSTPATTTSIGSPFGASSTPATTTSSGFQFGAPATTSSGFQFGASSTPATTSSGFSFGGSTTPATNSSVFPVVGSSTPATTSSGFSFGASSTPALFTTSAGLPSTVSSSPAANTTVSGFTFGTPSSTGTPAAGTTSSAFPFGASSTSTPVTSTAGFLSGSSSTFGAGSQNPFSFGAASTPATSTANNGSPFGFTAGSSTFPFTAGMSNNTSVAQPLFGNSNPFGSAAAANNNTSTAQSLFGNTSPFSSSSAINNNNQNSMEDSMAEDSVQASAPAFPAFGAQQSANTSNFGFGAPNPSGTSTSFQFGSQANLANPSPFQSSGSLGGFNAGGNFSLGSGDNKANRRIIKPKKGGARRK